MYDAFRAHLQDTLSQIRTDGLWKDETPLLSAQGARVDIQTGGPRWVNLCSNNYLGLANHPAIVEAASEGLKSHGFGLASVRFICGTQDLHTRLERRISDFLGTEDTILYPSCFDANGGLFETILDARDAVISDALNHASIIDGIRLSKAQRYRYRNNDLSDLEQRLQEASAAGSRFRLISTDGVFSMDGTIARLDGICELAEKHGALVHFDDCHGAGVLGRQGRGTHAFRACEDGVHIISGTLGKALGGASGGYISGRREIIALLRQRSRPYLFSNSVAPPIVCGALKAFELLESSTDLIERLRDNTRYFRSGLDRAGLRVIAGEHPIVPVLLGDARLASRFAEKMRERGVYVVAFSFPVVPRDQARIRTQVSASHSRSDLDYALQQFAEVQAELTG